MDPPTKSFGQLSSLGRKKTAKNAVFPALKKSLPVVLYHNTQVSPWIQPFCKQNIKFLFFNSFTQLVELIEEVSTIH